MAPVIRSIMLPDEDRGPTLLALYWTQCAISILVVSLRFYSRIQIRSLGLDDWTMLFTLALGMTVTALATLNVEQGGARHLYHLKASQIMMVLKLNWVLQPFAIMALATAKISVAFVMLRIISSVAAWHRRILYLTIISTFLVSATGAILTFVQCDPPRALWTSVLGAKCWHPKIQSDYAIFSAAWNSFIDVCLALLPISIIWKLQMAIEKKLGLCILLGLGILAGISAAIKTSKLLALRHRSDLTWETFDLFVWTSVELFCLIICGSLPTLKPVYELIFLRGKKKSSADGRNPLVCPKMEQLSDSLPHSLSASSVPSSSSFSSAAANDGAGCGTICDDGNVST